MIHSAEQKELAIANDFGASLQAAAMRQGYISGQAPKHLARANVI